MKVTGVGGGTSLPASFVGFPEKFGDHRCQTYRTSANRPKFRHNIDLATAKATPPSVGRAAGVYLRNGVSWRC